MIASKSKNKAVKPSAATKVPCEIVPGEEVLNIAEAARYLRVAEEEVIRLVSQQNLPGRQLGAEWRFLKAAIQDWLKTPLSARRNEGVWGMAGAWKDDPYLEEMLKEIYRKRGRPMTENA